MQGDCGGRPPCRRSRASNAALVMEQPLGLKREAERDVGGDLGRLVASIRCRQFAGERFAKEPDAVTSNQGQEVDAERSDEGDPEPPFPNVDTRTDHLSEYCRNNQPAESTRRDSRSCRRMHPNPTGSPSSMRRTRDKSYA